MSEGWIKLYRQIQDNVIWNSEPFSRGQAWVDLLLLANHDPGIIYVRDHKIEVKRGQVGWSENRLSKRWQWSRTKVRKFLKDLEKEQQIKQEKSKSYSIITIQKYDKYQSKKQEKEQQKNNRSTTERQQKDTNNNGNNGKNENNIPPEMSDVIDWLIDEKEMNKSTASDVANEFYSFYEMKNWKVGKNKMSKWKVALGRSLKWDSMQKIINNGQTKVFDGGTW